MPITFDTAEPVSTGKIISDTVESVSTGKITFETAEPVQPKIGFYGGLAETKQDIATLGIFSMVEATEAVTAKARLETDIYGSIKPLLEIGPYKVYPGRLGGIYHKSTDLRQHDLKIIEDYERKQRQEFTVGGDIGRGIGQMATWAAQMTLTAPIAKGIMPIVEEGAKASLTKALGGWGLTALARGAAMPQSAIQFGAEKMYAGEPPATAFIKGYFKSVIEFGSEEAGAILTKGLFKGFGKLPFGQKLFDALEKSWVARVPGRTTAGFLEKLYSEAGYSSFLGEWLEERFATILHGIAGTENFGVPDDPDDSQLMKVSKRLIAGLKQDFTVRNQIVEGVVLGLPTAFKAGVVHLTQEPAANPAQQIAMTWNLKDESEKTLTPEQKTVTDIYFDKIFTETERVARTRYPELTLGNLTIVGDMVRQDMGISQQVEFVTHPKSRTRLLAWIEIWHPEIEKWGGDFRKETIKPDSRFKVTFFGPNAITFRTLVHELSHITKPPYYVPLPGWKQQAWHERGFTYEEIAKFHGKRMIHPPGWREGVAKEAERLMKSTILAEGGRVPATEAALWAPEGLPTEVTEAPVMPVEPLTAIKPTITDTIVKTHNEKGGSTIDINTGEPVTKGFAVAIDKKYEQIIPGEKLTREQLDTYKQQYQDILDADKRRTIGTWVDNGNTYLDISTVVQSKEEAIKIGKENNQFAIFDLEKSTSIPIGPVVKPPAMAKEPISMMGNGFINESGKLRFLPAGLTHQQVAGGGLKIALKNQVRFAAFKDSLALETLQKKLTPKQIDRICDILKDHDVGSVLLAIGDSQTEIVEFTGVKPYMFRNAVAELKPPAMAKDSKRKQLGMIHGLAKKLKMPDAERLNLQEELVGVRSSADMTREQRQQVINTLETMYGKSYEVTKEDMQKTIQLGPNITMTVSDVFKNIKEMIESLPDLAEKIPGLITRAIGGKTLKTGLWGLLKDLTIGTDNSQMRNLGFLMNGKQQGIFSLITGDYVEWRERVQSDIKVSIFRDFVVPRLQELGVTPEDLAGMSNSQNPQSYMMQAIDKYMGKGTELLTIEINKRQFTVNWLELVDFYLTTEREASLLHLVDDSKNLLQLDYLSDEFREWLETSKSKKGGGAQLLFHDTNGGILVEKIQELRMMVQNNPKAMSIVKLWKEFDEKYAKPLINETSRKTIGEEIAKEKNYYGQEVVYPKGGKVPIPGRRVAMDAEMKRFLRSDTNSTAPLVIKDFSDRFMSTVNGIAEYAAMAEPTELLRTILNNPEFGTMWEKKGYGKVRGTLINILDNAQTITPKQGAFDKIFGKFLPKYFTAVLTNPRVWLSQFSSTMAYGAYIDLKYFKVVPDVFINWKEYSKEALANDSVLYNRFYFGQSTVEMGLMGVKDAAYSAFHGKMSYRGPSKLGIPMKVMDFLAMLAGRRIAIAEYEDAAKKTIKGESAEWWMDKETNWKPGSEGWNQLISQRSDFLWRTQSQWSKWRRSLNLSRPMSFFRSLFFFRSAHEALLNTVQESYWEFQKSNKTSADVARLSRKTGSIMASYAIDTVFRSLMLAAVTGRFKKPYEYILDLISNPLDMIAMLGKIISVAMYNFGRVFMGEAPQYRGRIFESPPLAVLQTFVEAPDNFAQAISFYLTDRPDQGFTSLKNAVTKVFESAGVLCFGMPVYEVRRIMKSAWVEGAIGEEQVAPRPSRRAQARTRRARSRR